VTINSATGILGIGVGEGGAKSPVLTMPLLDLL